MNKLALICNGNGLEAPRPIPRAQSGGLVARDPIAGRGSVQDCGSDGL